MLAQALARRFSRLGLHYGWAVVAVTFVTSLVTAGAMGLPGALILPLEPRIRLEHRADFRRAGVAHPALRADGALRRVADRSLRLASRDPERGVSHCGGAPAGAEDEPGLASRAAVGGRGRLGHRPHRAGDERDRGDAMVFRAPRPRARHPHREFGDRATDLPAARGLARAALRLARRLGADADRPRGRGRGGPAVHGRSAVRPRTCALMAKAAEARRPPRPPSAARSPCSAKSRAAARSGSSPRRSSSAA